MPKTIDVSMELPTDRIALRQIEHYEENRNVVIETSYLTDPLIMSRSAAELSVRVLLNPRKKISDPLHSTRFHLPTMPYVANNLARQSRPLVYFTF